MPEPKPEQPGYKISSEPLPPGPNVSIVNGYPCIKGRKRSLLVGINYSGQGALRGCHEDVKNVKNVITKSFGFPSDSESMRVLMDDGSSTSPTKANIEAGMKWLVDGAKSGDSLFFHYSGHGGQKKDETGDEADGKDETICPVDFQSAGDIVDDTMHEILVKPLAEGVKLTVIFDCCHSGTSLDLPFCYLADGQSKHSPEALMQFAKEAMSIGKMALAGDKIGAVKGLFGLMSKPLPFGKQESAPQPVQRDKVAKADIVLFSGCKDAQTSADACIENKATGAMSWALLNTLSQKPSQSYAQLLHNTRTLLQGKYSQIPQLSSGKDTDMNQLFAI